MAQGLTACEAVIIGGSAGSLNVLLEMLPLLKPDLDFPIVIVLHRKSGNESILCELLQGRTLLSVKEVEEKTMVRAGVIYLAPSNYHVLFEEDKTFSLDDSEKVNYSRPSIDVTFQSAAQIYKDGLVAIVLSGSNADGAAGLKTVISVGGKAVIQNPVSAIMPYMPEMAIAAVSKSLVLDADKIAGYINGLNR